MARREFARAFQYLRFSTGRQRFGDSESRQIERFDEWCKRNDVYPDTSLNLLDLGVTGFGRRNIEVGRLGAFLEAIKSGRVKPGDYLVLENLDRLTRDDIEEAVALFLRIITAGVNIVTTHPQEVIYRKGMPQMQLMFAVMELSRGNAESQRKSDFSQRAAKQNRERIANGEKIGGRGPLWLRFDKKRCEWVFIPERVEIVRRIYKMTIEGAGRLVVAKTFNREGIKTFGKGKLWSDRDIVHILEARTVFGEHQPHQWVEGFKTRKTKLGEVTRWSKWRVPIGDPVPNYYPAAVSKGTYQQARKAITARQSRNGKRSRVAIGNLFGNGLMKDARNGEPIRHDVRNTQRNNGQGGDRILKNAAKVKTFADGAELPTFPVDAFETAMLKWLAELKASHILGNPDRHDIEHQIATLEAEIADVERYIADLKQKSRQSNRSDWLDMIDEKAGERDVLKEQLERLLAERHYSAADSLRDVQSIVEAMNAAEGEKLLELRAQVANAIRNLISSIWLVIYDGAGFWRYCFAEVKFRAGGIREVYIATFRGELAWSRTDLRPEEAIDFDKIDQSARTKTAKLIDNVFEEQAAFDTAYIKLKRKHRRSEAGREFIEAIAEARRGDRTLSKEDLAKFAEAVRKEHRDKWLRKLGPDEKAEAAKKIDLIDSKRRSRKAK